MTLSEREHDRDALLRWHTLTEAADMSGLSRPTVYQAIADGVIDTVSIFGVVLLHDEDVAYLAARRKARS